MNRTTTLEDLLDLSLGKNARLIGRCIEHPNFGKGTVVSLSKIGDDTVLVVFEPYKYNSENLMWLFGLRPVNVDHLKIL